MLKIDFFFVSCAWLFISWYFPTTKVEAKNEAGRKKESVFIVQKIKLHILCYIKKGCK